MRVTTFNAIKNTNKKPKSPFDPLGEMANCFEFTTHEVEDLEQAYLLLANEWILSNAICIEEPITCTRTKANFTKLRCPNPGCVVVDIDEIKSYDAMKNVLDFFKNSEFNVILGKSKNWDGKVKFNLKGYIETKFNNDWINNRNFMSILNEKIGNNGKIDASASTDTSVQAPLFRNEVLLDKRSSDFIVDDDWIQLNLKYIKTKEQNEFIQQFDTSKLVHICYDIYRKQGFEMCASRNETINWTHPNEVKSKGGYFTYIETPHIMHHHNKEKAFNIFNEIKQTPEGQAFIKEQSAYELKKQFEENKGVYENELVVNQQYLRVDQKMKIFIKRFLKTGDIFKLKSAMGTGKSWVIEEIIEESRRMGDKVLLISNRISVANDYSEKYGIKTYLMRDDESWNPGEDLIVQMDSLWKYDIRNFDIVILDEFVSLMFQTISTANDKGGNVSDMRQYNAAKFFHILKSKKLVLADAFLSGYEDTFYKGKQVYYVQNNYRDPVDITFYDNRNKFAETIIEKLGELQDGETITASIISNDVIDALYDLATEAGYRVMKLNSNTSEDVKKIIYKKFEDEETSSWDLLLFSPTLTVGVSNMNKCNHHFHYDTDGGVDTISSLQMVKRSRKARNLHVYIKGKMKLEPTEPETLDDLFNQNIDQYFKGKQNAGITVEVDENANFVLSPIGKFMNTIQALKNRLENDHVLSFNVLLNDQFKFESKVITKRGRLDLGKQIKITKENIKQRTMNILDEHKFEYVDKIEEIILSHRTLSDFEKIEIMLYELKQKVNIKDKETIIEIAKADVRSNYKITNYISNLLLLRKKDVFKIDSERDLILTNGTSSLELKSRLNFLNDISKMFDMKLSSWYSEKDIKNIQKEYKLHDFKEVLRSIGYHKHGVRFVLNEDVKKFYQYFI